MQRLQHMFNANASGIKLIFVYLKKLIEMIEILNLAGKSGKQIGPGDITITYSTTLLNREYLLSVSLRI